MESLFFSILLSLSHLISHDLKRGNENSRSHKCGDILVSIE